MMSRIFKTLPCFVFAAAFAAMGVSSASATLTLTAVKCEGTGEATLCWAAVAEGKELFELSGSEAFKVSGGDSVFKVPALNIELLSTGALGLGVEVVQSAPLTNGYLIKGKLEFDGVTVDSPKGCKLSTGVVLTRALLGTPNKAGTELTFAPEAGATGAFAELDIEDDGTKECPPTVIGANQVKGTQKCSIPENAVDLVKHTIECKTTGSSLKYSSDPATFEGTIEGELLSKDPWSSQEA